MEENTSVAKAVEEIRGADEGQIREVINRWFEQTRTAGMKVGAKFISAAVYSAIEKNLKNGKKSSLRDYQRAIDAVLNILSVQLQSMDQDSLEQEDGV